LFAVAGDGRVAKFYDRGRRRFEGEAETNAQSACKSPLIL